MVSWDLEATPLLIKTDSTLGSDEKIIVWMYDRDGNVIAGLAMIFSSPMQYVIGYCAADYTTLPVQPPAEVDKIWTITKTETAIIITCNGVEVLNFLFEDSSKDNCVTRVGGGDVEQIEFHRIDKASDFYTCE